MKEISKLFYIRYGNSLDLASLTQCEKTNRNAVNFISRTSQNNGIAAIIEKIATIEPSPAGTITVAASGSVMEAFLQNEPYYTAYHVLILTPKVKISDKIKLYYCACIRANKYKYSYGRQANKTLKDIMIPDITEIPNWVKKTKMPDYSNINACLKNTNFVLNTKRWKTFKYDELFDIERDTGPRKQDLEIGMIPFITSTDTNNGISAFTNHVPTHQANTIGVNRNGSVAEAFYQENAFCSTEDVHIFKPKFKLNKYIAMFLATLIRKEKYRYSYGRKWGLERMKSSVIKLPATPSGLPDFEFMENLIKSLPYSSSI